MTPPKERPILFSAPMVRAIIDGSKTQTRRAISRKRFPCVDWDYAKVGDRCLPIAAHAYGIPGDRLWVRETWAPERDGTGCPDDNGVLYRATDPGWDVEDTGLRWRPSIHMPRAASRILLEITNVRVQRLQEISGPDCWAEGIAAAGWDCERYGSVVECFRDLWESINGSGSWDANPWVWAITFRRLGDAKAEPMR